MATDQQAQEQPPQDEGRMQQRLYGSADFNRIVAEVGCAYATRQPLFKEIQRKTRRKLISYVALVGHPASAISADDVVPFSSLLTDLEGFEGLDVMMHSGGGNADVAEKLIMMCRTFTGDNPLRVIVPSYAKSAATLFALGTDCIVMGYTSELGPIDPQIPQVRPGGQVVFTSAKSFLDSLDKVKKEAEETKTLNPALIPILSNVDLAFLEEVRRSIDRSREFAVKWLKRHMLSSRPWAARRVAEKLLNVEKYLSHGMVIDAGEAERIGLTVEKLAPQDDLWSMIWELYCRSELFLRHTQQVKLFETESSSTGVRAMPP
jgi:hypothetical protein